MDWSTVLSALSVVVILGVTLLSGPAIGVVDLTTDPTPAFGQGSATVDDVDAPATARFHRAFQSSSYYLEVPDARIHVTDLSGRPGVSYQVSIPELGYSRGSTYFMDEDDVGWVTVSISRDTLPDDQISERSYAGNLSVVLRYNDTEHTLYEGPVTVAVTE